MNKNRTELKSLAFTMKDDLDIVYLIGTAQQFWSELEEVLSLVEREPPTLFVLDSTLQRFLSLCATYHEQYLQSPLQLEHACNLLLDSELFQFHSERMCELIVRDAGNETDPHSVYIFYEVLFYYGRRRQDVFRSHKRWQPLLPLLMEHVLVEIDPDIEDTYAGTSIGRNTNFAPVPIPIEAKLRSLSVRLLYEVCRVQTLTIADMKIFDDDFIDYLFDLVEQTKYMHDETFNYSVIKLIISLNEQFMVVGLGDEGTASPSRKSDSEEPKNRILRVMMRRLNSCKTFGENMIFMLNRARHTPDDLCMTLLILKILYVLFTTKGTSDYFYTNDLCVLVDVFLREISDLDDDSEALRHTYLRVLHPLLTRTQLRDIPYKRPQVLVLLESLTSNSRIREVNPTTKRLVDRCLTGQWCVQLMELKRDASDRVGSPTSETSTIFSPPGHIGNSASTHLEGGNSVMKSLKYSKSVEHISHARIEQAKQPLRSPLDQVRRPTNASVQSLSGFITPTATKVGPAPTGKRRSVSSATPDTNASPTACQRQEEDRFSSKVNQVIPPVPPLPSHLVTSSTAKASTSVTVQPPPPKRRPPPPAPKRRKPPAIPVAHEKNGITITTIRSSEPSPLSKTHKPPISLQGLAS